MASNPERAICFLVVYNAGRNYFKHYTCIRHNWIIYMGNQISQCMQFNEIYNQSNLNFSNSVFPPFKPLWDGVIFLILHLFTLIVGYNSVC